MLNKKLKVYLDNGDFMKSDDNRVYEIVENDYIKKYGHKKLCVRVYDLSVNGGRGTVIYCDNTDDSITLDNATDEQIMTQVNNMFRNAIESIDENRISNKIKKLFK